MNLKKYEFWFLTGSQDLYGEETLVPVDFRHFFVFHIFTATTIKNTKPFYK